MCVGALFGEGRFGLILSSLFVSTGAREISSCAKRQKELEERISALGPLAHLQRERGELTRKSLAAKIGVVREVCGISEYVAQYRVSSLPYVVDTIRLAAKGLGAVGTGIRVYGLVEEIDHHQQMAKRLEGKKVGEAHKRLSVGKKITLLGEMLGVVLLVIEVSGLVLGLAVSPILTLSLLGASLVLILVGVFYPSFRDSKH